MIGLLLSALALGAPLAEAPQRTLTGELSAACVQVTGVPGEVVVESKAGVRFLQATRDGFTPRDEVKLGGPAACAEVATRPSGAGVVARAGYNGETDALVAAVRDPGGAWSAPVTIAASDGWSVDEVRTAVADSGDAIVGWTERRTGGTAYRLRVARRAPGQSFGPAEPIGATLSQAGALWVGVAATGEAFVMTAVGASSRLTSQVPVRIAVAPRGAPVPPPTDLGLIAWGSLPALAVAPDGRALVALPDGASLLAAERGPGEPFGAPAPVAEAKDAGGVRADVAIGANGEAAIAWTGEEENGVGIATRSRLGAFTPPVAVAPRVAYTGDPFFISRSLDWLLGISPLSSYGVSALTLTGDGHAALSALLDDDVHGVYQLRASLTTVALGGDHAETRTFGGVLGLSMAASPLELADGTPALVWGERINSSSTLHLAAEGATAPADPPPPTVRVGAPDSPVVQPGVQLVLPVSCSGPCDVRAQVLGGSRANGRLRLRQAGRGRLKVDQGSVPIAPRRLGPVRIRVTYGPIATQHPRVRTITLRLVRPAAPPAPRARVVGLRAVRRDGTIRVTWRVEHPEEVAAYFVTGAATREWSGEPLALDAAVATHRRRAFGVTLRADDGVRWVTLRSAARDVRITIRVR